MSKPLLGNHPPEKLELYGYSCDAVENIYCLRHLTGCRVREGREVKVACRIVWNNAAALYRKGYQGLTDAEDMGRLKLVLAQDERDNPSDYQAEPRKTLRFRRIKRLDDDDEMTADFIDPRLDTDEGNIIQATRRTVRLRDRSCLRELDAIADFYDAAKALDPAIRWEFVHQCRWSILP